MFQVGDRVVANRDYDSWEIGGRQGTVIVIRATEPRIGITFDGWSRGHNMLGNLTDRSGLWVPTEWVTFAKPKERVKRGFAKAVLKWETQNA